VAGFQNVVGFKLRKKDPKPNDGPGPHVRVRVHEITGNGKTDKKKNPREMLICA